MSSQASWDITMLAFLAASSLYDMSLSLSAGASSELTPRSETCIGLEEH